MVAKNNPKCGWNSLLFFPQNPLLKQPPSEPSFSSTRAADRLRSSNRCIHVQSTQRPTFAHVFPLIVSSVHIHFSPTSLLIFIDQTMWPSPLILVYQRPYHLTFPFLIFILLLSLVLSPHVNPPFYLFYVIIPWAIPTHAFYLYLFHSSCMGHTNTLICALLFAWHRPLTGCARQLAGWQGPAWNLPVPWTLTCGAHFEQLDPTLTGPISLWPLWRNLIILTQS